MLRVQSDPTAWVYDFRYEGVERGIVLRFHSAVELKLREALPRLYGDGESPGIFVLNEMRWGIEGALEYESSQGDITCVRARFPPSIMHRGEMGPDWDQLTSIGRSFSYLCDMLAVAAEFVPQLDEFGTQRLQYMLNCEKQMWHSCAIGVEMSAEFVGKLETQHQITYPDVNDAMKEVWVALCGPDSAQDGQFESRIAPPNRLHLSIPGSASGLDPSHESHHTPRGHGYRVDCHNIDTMAQQLALIAGMATLDAILFPD